MSAITETTVVNRGLQHLGATRVSTNFRTEQSKNAAAMRACYDTLRRTELRRNVWRFAIRKTALRALNYDSQMVIFPAYSAITTYAKNDIVLASDGQLYQSQINTNLGNDPAATIGAGQWQLYFGCTVASQYVAPWDDTITYGINQYVTGSNGVQYQSIVAVNLDNDPTSTTGFWTVFTLPNPTPSYFAGELVYTLTSPQVVYQSAVNGNALNPIGDTTGSWTTFTSAPSLLPLTFIYPIGTGPLSQTGSLNVYILPNGFLREAPQGPKAGVNAFLGGPAGLYYNDWEYESDYLTTMDQGPIVLRFCADVNDPTQFDPMFVEGFSGRLGAETCEEITQSDEKLAKCESIYTKFMGEARAVNGIETGSVEPPVDEYISVRW